MSDEDEKEAEADGTEVKPAGAQEGDPAHGIAPMPSPDGVEGATDFSVIDE